MNSIKTTISLNGSVYLFMCGVGLISPQLPGKMFALFPSAVYVGVLAAAFALAYVIVQIPMGILADRFGYKQFIILGYTACGLAGMIYLFSNTPNALILGRIIHGLGEAPLWALPPAILSILFQKKKGSAIGWYNGSIHLGLTSGSVIGFAMLRYVSEESFFQLYILLCILAVVLVIFGVENDNSHIIKKTTSSAINNDEKLALIMKPKLFIILKSVTFYGIGYGTFMTILPNYMSNLGDSNTMSTSLCFVALYLGITFAQFIGGPVTDKIGRLTPIISGLLLYSIGMMIFSNLPLQMMFWVLLVASFGLGIYLTGSIAYLNDQVGTYSKGYVSGLFYFFWGLGYFLGPILLGYLSELGLFEFGIRGLSSLGLTLALLIITFCRSTENQFKLPSSKSIY